MDFEISNLAPDCDAVRMTFGDHADSSITVTVDREENGVVTIYVVDNMDNSTREIVLGSPGFTEHSDFDI